MPLPMAKLITLLEHHLDRQPPTVVIQATSWMQTVLGHVKLQECGLAVHLHVKVCSCGTPQAVKNIVHDFI